MDLTPEHNCTSWGFTPNFSGLKEAFISVLQTSHNIYACPPGKTARKTFLVSGRDNTNSSAEAGGRENKDRDYAVGYSLLKSKLSPCLDLLGKWIKQSSRQNE